MSSLNVVQFRKNYTEKLLSWSAADTSRQFLPAALEIMETPASPTGRAVGATIILAFAIAIIWATFGRVDIIATASGKIVPTGRTKTIQPLEAGIITSILVRDGDWVTAGQTLIELDRTVSEAERQHVAGDLLSARLDAARLNALKIHLNGKLQGDDLIAPAGAPALDVNKARDWMLTQAAEQAAKVASLDRQIEQKASEYQQVKETIAKIVESLPLVDEGATVRRKAMEIQFGNRVAYLDAQTKLVEMQHEKTLQEQKLRETEAAQRALEQQRDQTIAGYARQISSDLSDAEKKVEGLSQDFVKTDRKYREQVLRAPIDGTVQQLAMHTVGGVVTSAQQLMSIVPDNAALEIEAMIPNADIGFVKDGQDVEIKIDTFNFTRYGILHGKVLSVSQDAIVKDKPPANNDNQKAKGGIAESSEPKGQELVYSARVSLDQTQMQIDSRLVNLVPGMAATVEFKTGSRRLIEYLMSPVLRYKHESMRER